MSEICESREQFQPFGEKLRPRIEAAGIQLSGEPEALDAHIVDRF